MTLAEIFAKQPAVTALEEMELLTVTGTHSGVCWRKIMSTHTPTFFTLKFKVS